jgi:hypothetical protein
MNTDATPLIKILCVSATLREMERRFWFVKCGKWNGTQKKVDFADGSSKRWTSHSSLCRRFQAAYLYIRATLECRHKPRLSIVHIKILHIKMWAWKRRLSADFGDDRRWQFFCVSATLREMERRFLFVECGKWNRPQKNAVLFATDAFRFAQNL